MAGIMVLSDTLKVGSKLEKTPTLRGNDVVDGSGNSAAGFAVMLSGSMNLNVDPKGQNSTTGQNSEEKQSTEDSVPSVQNPNGQGSTLGYGSFVLPFFLQPMLQSDLPAGKEANSGDDVSQETGGLATANASLANAQVVSRNNLELAKLHLVSQDSDEVLAQSGMTTPKPQGDNPEITELDKYRTVIADLLVALSGEIKDLSSKESHNNSESKGTKEAGQDTEKVGRGQIPLTNEAIKSAYGSNTQVENAEVQVVKGEFQDANDEVQVAKGEATLREVPAKTSQERSATQANVSSIQAQNPTEASISDLEETGEIKSSPKENSIGSERAVKKDYSQDTEYVIQGQRLKTDDVVKDGYAPRVEAVSSQAAGRVVPVPAVDVVAQERSVTGTNSSQTQSLRQPETLINGESRREEIKPSSPKESPIKPESIGTKEAGQDTEKVGRGQIRLTNEAIKSAYGSNTQVENAEVQVVKGEVQDANDEVQVAKGEATLREVPAKTSQERSTTQANVSSIQAQNPREASISDLEETGEIKSSPKENSIGSERAVKKDYSQDTEYVIQGQRLKTDDVVKDGYAPRVEAVSSQAAGRVVPAPDVAVVAQERSVTGTNSSQTQSLKQPETLINGESRREEIKPSSPKESPINSESMGTKEAGQDTEKVGRGQMPSTNEAIKSAYGSNTQVENAEVQDVKGEVQDAKAEVQVAKGEATLREVPAKTSQERSTTQANVSSIQAQNPTEASISDLEETGEIKSSPKENPIGSERAVKKDYSQDTEYVIQGQRLKTDDVVKDGYAPRVETASNQTAGRVVPVPVPAVAVVAPEGGITGTNSSQTQSLKQPEILINGESRREEIKPSSPKESPIKSESMGTKEAGQDTEKVGRGQMPLTNEAIKSAYGSNTQVENAEVQDAKGEVQVVIGEAQVANDEVQVAKGKATLREVPAKTSQERSTTQANVSSIQAQNPTEASISDLEETGEIKSSPKENPVGSERAVKKDYSQDTEYVIQGQRLKTDDVVKDGYAPRVEAVSSQAAGRVVPVPVPAVAVVAQEGGITGTNSSQTQSLKQAETLIDGESRREEIEPSSPKESPIKSESVGTKEAGQDTEKVGRGQMPLTNEAIKSAYGSNTQVENAEVQDAKGEVQDAKAEVQVAKGEATLREVPAKTSQERSTTQVNVSSIQAQNPTEASISNPEETGEIKSSPKENPIGSERVVTKNFSQDTEYVVQGQRLKTDDVAKGSYASAPRVEVASGQTILNAEGIPTKGFSQDMAKVVQGWKSMTNNGAVSDATTSDQKGIQTYTDGLAAGPSNAVLTPKVSMLQATLYPIVGLEGKALKASNVKSETLEAEADVTDTISKERLPAFIRPIKGMEDDLFLRKFQRAFSKDNPKEIEGSKSSETFGAKAPQYQNSSLGIGFVRNIVSLNSVETKTASVPVPVWQQISNVFSEQVLNGHQQLKELEIKLHPADLGKIQINLRWENGQVHLQVQASEVSTGQVLQNQLSELRQNLTSQGVNCGMLQMGQGGERHQNPHRDDSNRTFNQNTHPNEEEDLIPVTSALPLGQDEINRINVTA